MRGETVDSAKNEVCVSFGENYLLFKDAYLAKL
jgi:hypothetical protein